MNRFRSLDWPGRRPSRATAALAQPTDTLAKIKESGVVNIGSRDTQIPFSYRISGDGRPIGFTNDICLKVVEAMKAKLKLTTLDVRYTTLTSTNRIPLMQNGTVDLDCATTTNSLARRSRSTSRPATS